MKKNFKNLISPCVQCTGITTGVFRSFDHLRLFTTVRGKISKISYLRDLSAQVSQIVFVAHLNVLRFFYNCKKKNL